MPVRRVIVLVVLVATALCVGLVNAGSANAASFGRFYVGGCGMPASPVDMWTRAGNYLSLIHI